MRFTEGSVVLKRCLSIFSDLIFDSRVDHGMPSLVCAVLYYFLSSTRP